MGGLVAQYIAGAIVLIMVFLLLSDPGGTAEVIKSISSFNSSAINSLQGQGAPARTGSRFA